MSDFNKPNDKSRQDQKNPHQNPNQKPGQQHNPDRSQSSSNTINQKGKTEKTTW